MDKNTPKVFVVFLDTMVQFFDMALIQKTQDSFFELAAPFAGDNLHQFDLFVYRFLYDAIQFGVNIFAAVVDVVKVQFKFCHVNIDF